MCRVGSGLGLDFFHCFVCSADVSTSIRDHTCIEGSLCNVCPICREDLFSSRRPVQYIPCGHLLHRDCFERCLESDFRCALCRRSMVDMTEAWQKVDQVSQSIPARPLGKAVELKCWDCRSTSLVTYSLIGDLVRSGVVGLHVNEKCARCGSFNTVV